MRGPHRCVEVLVRWEGDWKDSWERASNLSKDLETAARAEAAWRFPTLQRKLEARADPLLGVRKRRLRALEAARAVRATGRAWRLSREGGLLSWNTAAVQSAMAEEWHSVSDSKRMRRVLLDPDDDSGAGVGTGVQSGVQSGGRPGGGESSQVAREGRSPRDIRQRVILDGADQPGARGGEGRVRGLVRMYELRNRAARSTSARGRDLNG